MRLFEIQQFGIESLVLTEREKPKPGYGQVLVRITAASLNYRDLMMVKGAYNPNLKRPMVPLSDGAGVVEETGPGVTRFKAGDRVCGIFFQTWIDGPPTRKHFQSALGGAIDGIAAEYVVFDQDGLVPTPEILSDIEAATLPCAGVTAWHALFEHTRPAPGESVLIQGTGGVSTFALVFARAAGLRAIVTSSSDEKLGRARELGAEEGINYKTTPEWQEETRKLTDGEGIDHIVEVGGKDTLPRSLKAIRPGGAISVIGVLSGRDASIGPGEILSSSARVQGIYVGSRAMFERMNKALAQHQIRPVIGKVFPFPEFKEALQYMESAQHFGKICLKW